MTLKRLVNRLPGVNVDCWAPGVGHDMRLRSDEGVMVFACRRKGCWYHYFATADEVAAASPEEIEAL